MKSKLYPALLACAFGAGCVSFKDIPTGSTLQMGADEGIVIIGAPPGVELVVHSGDLRDSKFSADGWFPDGVVGSTEGGYMVRKLKAAKPGRAYALVSIKTAKRYSANCGQSVATFTVRPGEVQYITSFDFVTSGQSVRIQSISAIDAARTYVKQRYPEYSKEVIQGVVGSAQQNQCENIGGTVYIPIYVPVRR